MLLIPDQSGLYCCLGVSFDMSKGRWAVTVLATLLSFSVTLDIMPRLGR